MTDLLNLLANPLLWKIILGYWLFSAAVGALPTPTTQSYAFYEWAFRFLHLFAGNVNRAAVALKVLGTDPQQGGN